MAGLTLMMQSDDGDTGLRVTYVGDFVAYENWSPKTPEGLGGHWIKVYHPHYPETLNFPGIPENLEALRVWRTQRTQH